MRDAIRGLLILMENTFTQVSDEEFMLLNKQTQDEHRAAMNLIESMYTYVLTIDKHRQDTSRE